MLFYEGSDGELGGDGTPSGRAKERSIAGRSGQGDEKAEDVKDKDDKTSNRYDADKNESGESGGGKKPA
jgi:hypothetical protein